MGLRGETFPCHFWSDLSRQYSHVLLGRSGKQIRERWINHLDPTLRRGPFTRDEDTLLWEGVCNIGKQWSLIAKTYFHSTRSDNSIKNRFKTCTFKHYVKDTFGPDAYKDVDKKETTPDAKQKKNLKVIRR